jgi:hypothetical protein
MALLVFGAACHLRARDFSQSATVVMRYGDHVRRVRAEVLSMGLDFTLRLDDRDVLLWDGVPKYAENRANGVWNVPVTDVVLIDFTGNGRNISEDELSRANAAGRDGFVVLKNGDSFRGRLVDVRNYSDPNFPGTLRKRPAVAVFFPGRRAIELSNISRIYLGTVKHLIVQAKPQ